MFPVLIIGGGPAGLATSRELMRRGIEHRVLERGAQIGHSWRQFYDSLTLHTGKHMSSLPGLPFPGDAPLFLTRDAFIAYLERYCSTFGLPVETECEALRIKQEGKAWTVDTLKGIFQSRFLVMATGIASQPHRPAFHGEERFEGSIIHSADYRRPQRFAGKRVLVVGVGNSGGEIAAELAQAGARVTVSVRAGAAVLPRQILGIPVQYFSCVTSRLPLGWQRSIVAITSRVGSLLSGPSPLPPPTPTECPGVPLIGFHLVDAIRKGLITVRGAVQEFTANGVRFADGAEEGFDQVVLATGYSAALGPLKGLIHRDGCGFAQRHERVVSRDSPDLFFVGHNYDATGGLFNIRRDSCLAAGRIAARTA